MIRNNFFVSYDIYLFSSSGINKSNSLVVKLNAALLNYLIFFVFNKLYICRQIEEVVEAIAGIIFPEISFTFKISVFSLL
jgi:hypothetical protein